MRTCKYCGNRYEDSWKYWYNKFCCSNCFRTANTKYKVGDKVYTYVDHKFSKSGISIAETTDGTISKIYKQHNPTTNGLYQYSVMLPNNTVRYRFVHQIFNTKEECDKFVALTNKRREIMRQAKNLFEE